MSAGVSCKERPMSARCFRRREMGGDMWLALAAVTLVAAMGFCALALAIEFER
jgi:hypothetical protein